MKKSTEYNLYIKLEREGANLTIQDNVDIDTFDLQDYIFKYDLEGYNIIEFDLKRNNEEC